MLAAEARTDRAFLEGIVQRRLRREELLIDRKKAPTNSASSSDFAACASEDIRSVSNEQRRANQPMIGSRKNWLSPVNCSTRLVSGKSTRRDNIRNSRKSTAAMNRPASAP